MFFTKKKLIIFILLILALLVVGVFFVYYQTYYSKGGRNGSKIFEIEKGEGLRPVASRLAQEDLISGEYYFFLYLRLKGVEAKILPGAFELNGNMTIPEIAYSLTQTKKEFVKITFPEGWTTKEMAKRLENNGFSGEEFLNIANNPSGELKKQYSFLASLPEKKSLEGYLFPDTYFFAKEATAEGIIRKMLDNFALKMEKNFSAPSRPLHEAIVMASILEGEVRSTEDRKIVSGIFWNRMKVGQALQSCATLAYVLGENKKQYSFEDTRTPSPYNTYLNPGLPPGPIANPGLDAILAALKPTDTSYNYFLSDPETGRTVFSKTIEEHNVNKVKYGL